MDDLCHRKLRDISDFEWQRYIRPYLRASENSNSETVAPPPSRGGSAGAPNVGPEPSDAAQGNTVVLQCLDQQIEYGFEYLGCTSLPVFTTRANNYIIAFTQVSVAQDSSEGVNSQDPLMNLLIPTVNLELDPALRVREIML